MMLSRVGLLVARAPRTVNCLAKRWHGDCEHHLTMCIELACLLDANKALKPDVLSTLQELEDAHHNIVFVSNIPKSDTAALMQTLGLPQHLKACSSTSIPVKMPNPGILIYAIETLAGGEISNSISVGNSADNVRMAKAAGVPVINIRSDEITNGLSSTADLRIDSFDQVLTGIETLKDSSTY
jgi:phosphoglycolate phosphatase-like HAD superfamily hydrolase